MKSKSTYKRFLLPALALLLAAGGMRAHADEGMWLYNRIPRERLAQHHNFVPTPQWLEHLARSSVRLGGASAAFVSPEGLLLSNHHVGAGAIQRLSTKERNLMRDGYLARTRSQELPCPGVEARVLVRIEDVTARVAAAIGPGLSDHAAFETRRAVIAEITKEASRDDLSAEVVPLFQGAEYHAYIYKRYTDLRLVFAPEEQIASFGGDADNFEYPRFNLDACFFRAYENGQPAKTEHYLRWARNGVREGELVFVSGHPGRTDRLRAISELRYLRDVEFPRTLERVRRIEVLLGAYALRDPENARRARSDLKSAENSRKARDGMLAGLLDPDLMERKVQAEARLRAAPQSGVLPGSSGADGPWKRISDAQAVIEKVSLEYDLLETGSGFNSALFWHARRLIRAAEEREKPDEQRLEEYRTPALPTMELGLFAEAPIYPDLETVKLGDSLTHLAVSLGGDHELVKKVLAGKSPVDRAGELVRGTRLASAAERRKLYEAVPHRNIRSSDDPMIQLAILIDEQARRVRNTVDVGREAIRQGQALIGKVRYALDGPSQPPDATGTLRLSFGTVTGYEQHEKLIPPWTTFAGLFERAAAHQFRPPFELPSSWSSKRKRLDSRTPFNFVCTADIIGGNSGSPVVNRQGEVVGVIFDSNLQGLGADVEYTDQQARAVAVDARGIVEALRVVYNARALLEELQAWK
jgi:hypothetical protein